MRLAGSREMRRRSKDRLTSTSVTGQSAGFHGQVVLGIGWPEPRERIRARFQLSAFRRGFKAVLTPGARRKYVRFQGPPRRGASRPQTAQPQPASFAHDAGIAYLSLALVQFEP